MEEDAWTRSVETNLVTTIEAGQMEAPEFSRSMQTASMFMLTFERRSEMMVRPMREMKALREEEE